MKEDKPAISHSEKTFQIIHSFGYNTMKDKLAAAGLINTNDHPALARKKEVVIEELLGAKLLKDEPTNVTEHCRELVEQLKKHYNIGSYEAKEYMAKLNTFVDNEIKSFVDSRGR